MEKQLSEMSLEELWQLFPIYLTKHQNTWKSQYIKEEKILSDILFSYRIIRISHIGSTAVDSIWAKPIVDIMIEVDPSENIEHIGEKLALKGFIIMNSSEKRIVLNLGYSNKGFLKEVFHIHLRYAGDNNELYFRDYLNDHIRVAKRYEKLKIKLWHKYEHNRDAYTDGKGKFIIKYTKKAKKIYNNKYGNVDHCICNNYKCVYHGNCIACKNNHLKSKELRPCER